MLPPQTLPDEVRSVPDPGHLPTTWAALSAWSVLAPIGVVAVSTLVVMARLVRSVRVDGSQATPGQSTPGMGPLVPVPHAGKPLASS